jgi:hypothetical protein
MLAFVVTVPVQNDLVTAQDARLNERPEAAIAIDAARAVEIRDYQQRDWTEVEIVEEREDPGAVAERRRRDVVQRNTERARQCGGHAIRMGSRHCRPGRLTHRALA